MVVAAAGAASTGSAYETEFVAGVHVEEGRQVAAAGAVGTDSAVAGSCLVPSTLCVKRVGCMSIFQASATPRASCTRMFCATAGVDVWFAPFRVTGWKETFPGVLLRKISEPELMTWSAAAVCALAEPAPSPAAANAQAQAAESRTRNSRVDGFMVEAVRKGREVALGPFIDRSPPGLSAAPDSYRIPPLSPD